MSKQYDAIIVGARCAGAPTAMLLARLGYSVLVVDRATFPSDTLSTHVIHAPGVAALQRWGLLDRVIAAGCPPIETYSFDFGPFTIKGTESRTRTHRVERCSTRSSSTLQLPGVRRCARGSQSTRSSSRTTP